MKKTKYDYIPFDVPSTKQAPNVELLITQARRKYRAISIKWVALNSDDERLILLLDVAVELNLDLHSIRILRDEIWHAVLTEAYSKGNQEWNITYKKYLRSEAWKEKRHEYFSKFGVLCICGRKATVLHHKTYKNVGKENIQKDLTGLCEFCHKNTHNLQKRFELPTEKESKAPRTSLPKTNISENSINV